ncbi:MAG: hypothetical protein O7E52_20235 [Candidatus Poribacteria bacterium]|nr:hypothetical protein [Candidatus Poribacteria bacterium]
MPTVEERVDRLETAMIELAEAQMRTQVSLKALSDEMRDFKDEMRDFKGEMRDFKDEMRDFKEEARADRKRQNEKWGELANKWGTVVEDIVVPNIPRIARENFGWSDVEDFMIRRKVRSRRETSKRREFDVIAIGEDQIIINETKSQPRIDYINAFIEVLGELEDYLPEYIDKTVIPIFASLSIGEDVVNYLTRNRIFAMAMGDETMELKNYRQMVDPTSIE